MPAAIHAIDLILRKRSGGDLSDAGIRYLVQAVVAHGAATLDGTPRARQPDAPHISEAQLGALLMAIYQHGLDPRELATLTEAMRTSGDVFDPAPLHTGAPVFLVDKHSTGGVGDKTSLLIAPIVAAAGLAAPTSAGTSSICVPMISGRSLGHTGGTLDKLETIPGFDTELSLTRFAEVLRQTGAALIGQTPALVPADRILYALRDHTGTVESPFLITASIMSKKLAESLNALVLDVKVGSGAFLPTLAEARHLAHLMVETGTRAGTPTVALLTAMDQPLGRFAGNWLEVRECVEILQGRPHPLSHDLIDLSLILSGWMLHLAHHAPSPEAGAERARDLLESGDAYQSWLQIVKAQGGDTTVFADPAAHHQAAHTVTLTAPHAGYLSRMDCRQVGWAVQRLGAGRTHPGAPVSASAGIEMHARLGDHLTAGQPIVTLYAETRSALDEPLQMLREALHIAAARPTPQPLVQQIIDRDSLQASPEPALLSLVPPRSPLSPQ